MCRTDQVRLAKGDRITEFGENHKRWLRRGTVLVVVSTAAWAVWHFWPNRHLARAHELRDQLTGEAGRALSAADRQQLWAQFRQEAQHLSPAQRRGLFREQQQRRMREYFNLSEKDRVAYLDRFIDRMEQARRERQQNGNGTGPGGPPGGRQLLSAEEREKRRKQRLDWSTPEERVERSQFFADLRKRREQRGLGNSGWGGRW